MNRKEKKIVIIIVAIGVVLLAAGIALAIWLSPTINDRPNDGSSVDDSSSETNPTPPPTNTPADTSDAQPNSPWNQGGTQLTDFLSSNPISQYIYPQAHRTAYYTISPQMGTSGEFTLVIRINMPTPSNDNARRNADRHYQNALQQIRDWGFEPNNYTIKVMYRD